VNMRSAHAIQFFVVIMMFVVGSESAISCRYHNDAYPTERAVLLKFFASLSMSPSFPSADRIGLSPCCWTDVASNWNIACNSDGSVTVLQLYAIEDMVSHGSTLSLGTLNNLTSLSLQHMDVEDGFFSVTSVQFDKQPLLATINIFGTSLTTLADFNEQLLPSLVELSLPYNRLFDTFSICSLSPTVTKLDLRYNLLQGTIPPCLSRMGFTSLEVSFNNISGDLSALAVLDSLESFDVSNNTLINGSLPLFNVTVSKLKLAIASFTQISAVPPSYGRLKNLLQLDVQHCAIDSFTLDVDPTTSCNSNLGIIFLSYNNLKELHLPDSLCHLFRLEVCCNQLVSLQVPKSASMMGILVANHNALSDLSLPSTLLSLYAVDLSDNRFQAIPNSFFHLPALQRLLLSNNSLSYVPARVCDDVKLLQFLEVQNNVIAGSFPSLASCNSLRYLDVSRNLITSLDVEGASLQIVMGKYNR
jgi:Leucine-rich repeat (LRR) protein